MKHSVESQHSEIKNPKHYTIDCQLSQFEQTILDFLVDVKKNYGTVYPSQISIAKKFGVHRSTVNRAIGKLSDLGLILRKRRYNDSCIYKVLRDAKRSFVPLSLSILFLGIARANFQGSATLTNLFVKEPLYQFIYKRESYIGEGDKNGDGLVIKKRVVDSEQKGSEMTKQFIPGMELLPSQQKEIMEYPEKAREYATWCYKNKPQSDKPRNPFGYYISVMKAWCERNKISLRADPEANDAFTAKKDWKPDYMSQVGSGPKAGDVVYSGGAPEKRMIIDEEQFYRLYALKGTKIYEEYMRTRQQINPFDEDSPRAPKFYDKEIIKSIKRHEIAIHASGEKKCKASGGYVPCKHYEAMKEDIYFEDLQ